MKILQSMKIKIQKYIQEQREQSEMNYAARLDHRIMQEINVITKQEK